jgi:hypothetical protein
VVVLAWLLFGVFDMFDMFDMFDVFVSRLAVPTIEKRFSFVRLQLPPFCAILGSLLLLESLVADFDYHVTSSDV